jgi:hypothetical protein
LNGQAGVQEVGKFTLDNLGRLEKKIPPELPMEGRLAWAGRMVILWQLFTFTSALNDTVGLWRTSEILVPMAKETGLRIGTK